MSEELSLKNHMEDYVESLIPSVLKNMNICKCDQCKMDITAYALNHLKPKYVATHKGHIFARVDEMHSQFGANVITAITEGAQLVGSNPRHG